MLRLTSTIILITIALSIDIPNCISRKQTLFTFSYINGTRDYTTTANICHDNQHLHIRWDSIDQDIIAPYKNCNDPLYNGDAVQIFIATLDSYPTQYYQLQVSPNQKLFFADIHNPTNNCQQLSSVYEDCEKAGYKAKLTKDGWTATLKIRLDVIGRGQLLTKFKINLLRIDVNNGEPTRFLTWKPTYATPPCFHVPSYFEQISLI